MKFLGEEGLGYFLSKITEIFASKAQGIKADTAVQSVKIGSEEYKSGTSVVLPEYPTSLPASDVSSWAKASSKPTYTASEVGADAKGTASAVQENLDAHTENVDIHFTAAERTKLSDIAAGANAYSHPNSGVTAGTYKSVTVNAQGHVTGGSNPTTLAEYGITDAESKGAASSAVSSHNTNTSAHDDIRTLITNLTTRLNTLADSDDTTLDQLSEIVAYIKENKELIESVTTNKVNVADIIDNLTTNVSNKPLSAAQGVAIKALIDALQTAVNGKAEASDLTSHTGNTSNPHSVTKAQVGLGNVENKSSVTIRGELTKENVTDALGYTPPTTDTTYGVATSSALGLVKSGTDITVDSSGNVTVKDDSHNHVISNVDGLQSALYQKVNIITLTNEDLNSVKSVGFYNAAGGNAVTNKPSGVEHFGMYIIHNASGEYYTQILVDGTNGKSYRRHCMSGTWGNWSEDKLTDTIYSAATTSTAGLMSTADKAKSDATNIAYGTCSTAAATAAKVITISGNTNWKLAAGSMIAIKFTNTNTAQNPTFNVNNTGAKSVWYNTSLITTGNLGYAGYANRTANYIYDGTQYVFIGWSIDSNTTYSNASLGQGYGTCSTDAATAAKVVTLSSYSLVVGGIVAVKFTYAVPASATLNINSKGAKPIFYRGSAVVANAIKAGDVAVFIYDGTNYHLLTIDRDNNTTYSAMTGATASVAGKAGLVPAPAAGDQDKVLCGDGTYRDISELASEDEGFTTFVASDQPVSPADNTIWIYDASATNDIISGDMVVGSEPSDTSKNPTWIEI